MNDQLLYLVKVSAGLGIIVLPYLLLLREDPNLHLKRLYLLAGVVAAWIFPLITFRRPDLLEGFTPTIFIDPAPDMVFLPDPVRQATESRLTVNWFELLIVLYMAGMAFMLLKNLYLIIKWNLIWHKTHTGQGLALTDGDQVFTLFTRIFIPRDLQENPDLDQLLLHERAHVRQYHFIDLIIMELTLLITWFNPFSWLISRMIKENHEHLADRQVLSAGINPARYRAQLLNHALGVNVFRLGNQFNHSLTFKRFKMMKKPNRSPWGVMKLALMIPAVMIVLGLTTGMAPQEKMIRGKVVIADTKEPAPGAAVIIVGTTIGTVTDIKGDFALQVEGDPEIAISFVGYSTLKIRSSRITDKPLELEKSVYRINLDESTIEGKNAVVRDDGFTFKGDRVTVDNEKAVITGSVSFKKSDSSEASPVFVLDGKVVTEINDLDPGTIEKIEVIKDPDSEIARKYGATDGVILITTKKKPVETSGSHPESQPGQETFYIVEDMPSFPGGNAALSAYIDSHLQYPEEEKRKGIQGEVQVQFTVKATGKIDDVKVIHSVYPGLDQAAKDVIEGMPEWNPGRQRGKPVSVNVVIPVRFKPDAE